MGCGSGVAESRRADIFRLRRVLLSVVLRIELCHPRRKQLDYCATNGSILYSVDFWGEYTCFFVPGLFQQVLEGFVHVGCATTMEGVTRFGQVGRVP
jgi:hypothetical protein